MTDLHVVWFRRDLRVHDHAPLLAAVASGAPVLPLYIFEPGFWAQPEHSGRQFDFLVECLQSLDDALKARGSALCIRTGKAEDVLADIHTRHGIAAIHVHRETGLQWTFDRDRSVQRWTMKAGIALREQAQNGVGGHLSVRDGWPRYWEDQMSAPRGKAPDTIAAANVPSEPWPIAEDFRLAPDGCTARQPGGRAEGVELLRSFLASRGRRYRTSMSDPLVASVACSRLSPHLAFGTVSVREAWQAARRARAEYDIDGDSTFTASIDNFLSRLQWRCQFFQKLEDQTSIDRRNLLPGPDGVREVAADGDPRLEAWIHGRTGFPFLDACMRSLNQTGWLNFRMRAMTMAFAAHHLWLDARLPAARLAALFTDFEAAIHYPQAMAQAAIISSHAPRIYNPVKQSLDHDPDGDFIRRWVPELAGLPTPFIHAPWDAPKAELARAGIVLGQTYPMRIVDHMAAAREARGRIQALRHGPTPAPTAISIGRQDTGRTPRARASLRRPSAPPRQLAFDLDLPEQTRPSRSA
ncbi:FAD-binding domain-containing protein [Hyphomonas johnsonii]|nr:deoxyribodipyrimidine photo-lyase [Hyphomonas johnsonii]